MLDLTFSHIFPCLEQAWIALEAAEVPYKFEQVSLYGSGGKPSWFMKLNPKGQVPVVVVNNDNDKEKVILADSDLILDEMELVMDSCAKSSSSSSTRLLAGKNDEKIKAFRSVLRKFLPIGKSAVLGGDKERMWSKLRELDKVMDTNGQASYICSGTDQPTIADCAGFPFLWRIDNEFGSDSWESHGCQNISAWLEFCKRQPPFENSIQRSWWWWW